MEAVQEPGGAGGFVECGRGDADELELPLAELGLVEVEPMEGSVDGGEAGEACDAALGEGGGGHGFSWEVVLPRLGKHISGALARMVGGVECRD